MVSADNVSPDSSSASKDDLLGEACKKYDEATHLCPTLHDFRAAIQLQFDFHRAIYNLGTVLYGLAEDTSRTGGSVNVKEVSSNELFSQSAIYIAAAHALKPTYSVSASCCFKQFLIKLLMDLD
ncbi:hypothetical protein CsSME_00025730 [Camellia sinensis var. sinensis]|uniref:protein HLB1-like n=1 Tax=Camellia sinensis TaxID=4442 RepID=UPI001035ED1A|nr:protein HLB1-like [Camellia sinensis]